MATFNQAKTAPLCRVFRNNTGLRSTPHQTQLRYILGPPFHGSKFSPAETEQLSALRNVLESCYSTFATGEKGERGLEDIITDVLVWRCILTYMLFTTAPDTSGLLRSRVWDAVVPII